MDEPCFFCQKLRTLAQLPEDEVVWEFPHSVALLGPWQYFAGYCILVSRRHATELFQLSAQERQAYVEEMNLLARAIAGCFTPRKMNYELLGNQVANLHWHLFPRRDDDPDKLKPVWLALDSAEHDAAEKTRLQTAALPRAEIAARLRAFLQNHLPR